MKTYTYVDRSRPVETDEGYRGALGLAGPTSRNMHLCGRSLWRDTERAMRKVLPLVLAVCAALPARAAPSCKGISVTPLAFGSYDVYGPSPLDSAGTISYSCPPPALPTVTIDQGLSFGNGRRRMALGLGSDFLEYEVYVD